MKKGDFVKINYTGKLKDGDVFDTTLPDVAKAAGLGFRHEPKPVTICVGEGMLIPGLDAALVGKTGKFHVDIPADQAFGYMDAELMQVVPEEQLREQKITPKPGLRLNIDGQNGVVRTVSPGRIVVDFNHPLAGRDLVYDVEIVGLVTDLKEQVQALLDPIGIPYLDVAITDKKAIIKLTQMLPQPVLDALNERITRITAVETVAFEQGNAPA